jgi:hypothetical protein
MAIDGCVPEIQEIGSSRQSLLERPHHPVGAKLARDDLLSSNITVECEGLIASKLYSYKRSA